MTRFLCKVCRSELSTIKNGNDIFVVPCGHCEVVQAVEKEVRYLAGYARGFAQGTEQLAEKLEFEELESATAEIKQRSA